MKDGKFQLLIDNSRELDKVGGLFSTTSSFRKCNALSFMIKDKKIDANKVNEAIEVVRKNTSMFSNFRGNNLLTVAVTISQEEDMECTIKEIIYIYESLKSKFIVSQYLVLAAIIIFNARHRVDVVTAITNTRVVYESMKKNHGFLTSSEDVSAAAMIATTSENLNETMEEIEDCYELLRKNGFVASNNLQSLSHMVALFNGTVEEKTTRIVEVRNALKDNKVPLKGYSLPLLAIAAACMDSTDSFARKVYEVSDELRGEKGFGAFSLQADIRNMLALAVVASSYVDNLDSINGEKLINTANNIALTIQIAMEMAAVMAASSAAAAAAAAN